MEEAWKMCSTVSHDYLYDKIEKNLHLFPEGKDGLINNESNNNCWWIGKKEEDAVAIEKKVIK